MQEDSRSETLKVRVAKVPAGSFSALAWIGPALMVLGAAIGSGEILAEPAAGAKYGGSLLWMILFIIVTKAFWNKVVGRVAIITGQNFLETCSSAGPVVGWVPWAWYAINGIKDFLLRGGIVAIAGLISYDIFGPLPLPIDIASGAEEDRIQGIAWTLLNYGIIWTLLVVGGYKLAEKLNMVLCILFTICLLACALAVLPQAAGELARGLVPAFPSDPEKLLMMVSLSGIVMSGSATICYTAWTEERRMGLFGFVRSIGRRMTKEQIAPSSDEEIRRMHRWLRINSINITLAYFLGALLCLSTYTLGVAILRPAGVTLTGPALAPELSLMMTEVIGPWAKWVFYAGAWAAVVSTAIGILDGSSRMYTQPIRQVAPKLFARFSFVTWQKLLMTLMVAGSWLIYLMVPDALKLVIWMGAVDAPLVGILIIVYAYLDRCYMPEAYRSGKSSTVAMTLIGILYLGLGAYFFFSRFS